jgi:hypothetical protein
VSVSAGSAAEKDSAGDAAVQTIGDTLLSLITGKENRNVPALASTASKTAPVFVDAETEKIPETGTPALILDAIAVLFRVLDADMIAARELVDGAEEGEAELASKDAVPPEDVSPDLPKKQVKIPAEKIVSTSGLKQNRQSSLPAKSETKNTGRDSAGEETDLAPGAEGGDHASDDPETHEAGEFPAKEPVPDTGTAQEIETE